MKKIHESKNSKKFNATINQVFEEMQYAENVISNWRVNWEEKYSVAYCYDLQYLTEDEIFLLSSIYDYKYDLSDGGDITRKVGAALARETLTDYDNEEYICEFRKIDWVVTNNKISRMFSFGNLGDISYSQVKSNKKANDESYNYYSTYNVLDNSLGIRFVRENEDMSVLFDGDKRVIESDGICMEENSDGMVVSSENNGMIFTINFDAFNRIDNKVLRDGNDIYIICGNEIISATRIENDEEIELELTEELIEVVTKKISEISIGNLNKYEIQTLIASMKMRLTNAIKSISGDVPLKGLSRRLNIAMSMINAKCAIKEESKKKLKK